MSWYEKEQQYLKQLHDEIISEESDSGDEYKQLFECSDSEPEEFRDDGLFNGDPDYVPDDSEEDNEDVASEIEEVENREDEENMIIEDENSASAAGMWYEDTKPIPEFGFDNRNSGPVNIDANCTRFDVFKRMLSDEIFDMLIKSTNNYGKKLCESNRPSTRHRRMLKFRETDKTEFSKFLGLCLLQAQTGSPSIRHSFSNHCLYYHPIFSYSLSGRRFEQLLRCLSCYMSQATDKQEKQTKLGKISDLIKIVNKNFQESYKPDKKLSLDESLLLFRGRLSFRQYIPNKKARYGIKFFELTTSDGYVLNVEIYQGKSDSNGVGGKTSLIVKRLLAPYLNLGHHIYMDNFYNSVELSQELMNFKTHTTGTLRKNRKGNPKAVVDSKIKKGEQIWRRSGDVYISKWKDKREVLFISTANNPELIEVPNKFGQLKIKPKAIADYNANMSGVDRCDQMVQYYSSPRKTIRWYKKVIFHLIDLSAWNSYYIYKKFHPKETFLNFRDNIIQSLLQLPENVMNGPDLVIKTRAGRPRTSSLPLIVEPDLPQPLVLQHIAEKIPAPEGYKRKTYFLRCRQCWKNNIRKETSFRCKGCKDNPPLCPTCFQSYHSTL